jgi:hypothetical protein
LIQRVGYPSHDDSLTEAAVFFVATQMRQGLGDLMKAKVDERPREPEYCFRPCNLSKAGSAVKAMNAGISAATDICVCVRVLRLGSTSALFISREAPQYV